MFIPRWDDVPDFFVWEAFDQASADRARVLTSTSTQQEALLAETSHFYVVPDQFGVADGHVLVLPKAATTSIASLDAGLDDELHWLLKHVADAISGSYDAHAIIAEHGECGCATAGQAHVHVLPIPSTITSTQLRAIVDRVLQRRLVGVDRVIWRDHEFTALEDLRALVDADGATVVGRQLSTRDLAHHVDYPAGARTAIQSAPSYVYFSGPGVEFLSTCHFRSQFVREVVGLAVGLQGSAWNRWANTSRSNMFATYARLSSWRWDALGTTYGFAPRSGR